MNTVMRILQCIPSMLNGGAQRQLTYLAAEQVRRGWAVHVALLYDGPNFDRLKASGACVHRLSGRSNYDPRLLWQLIRVIRQVKPDVVQTWINQMDVFGGVAARLTSVPWVLSERTSAPAYPSTLKNRLRALLAVGANAVVSNSAGGDAYWASRLPARTRRYVIPNAVPLDEIAQAQPISTDEVGLEPARKMVLYVGRLSPEKNLENLIPALRQAAERVPLTAYLCGDGTHRAWAEQLIEAHGASGCVHLIGYRPDVWNWMKAADLFISVSLFEGNPNTVLEAMACNCPLVVSDIPEHREFLNEQCAQFVNPYAPDEIAEAVLRVFVDPETTAHRIRQARTRVAQWGSVPNMACQYERVYQDIILR